MDNQPSVLCIIPARAGSNGLSGKALRPLCGIPLIAHSILCARRCGLIPVITTDGPDIAYEAIMWGAEVIMRPAELCTDEAPLWPSVRHALDRGEERFGPFDYVLLLDPSSPGRLSSDVAGALALLEDKSNTDVDGVLGVHKSEWSPYWHMVKRDGNGMAYDVIGGLSHTYNRRQDVPDVYCINASLYLWRASFVRAEGWTWRNGKHLLWPIPAIRALHIDDEDGLRHAQAVIDAGLVELPWVDRCWTYSVEGKRMYWRVANNAI